MNKARNTLSIHKHNPNSSMTPTPSQIDKKTNRMDITHILATPSDIATNVIITLKIHMSAPALQH